MVDKKIEFRKIRDFGENFTDTFTFLRNNLKSILPPFLAISGVFILGQAIFSGLYQSKSFGVFDRISKGVAARTSGDVLGEVFTWDYILSIIFTLMAYASMKVMLGSYIKIYVDNDGAKPTLAEVWTVFRQNFFRVFFAFILTGILIVVGCFFCFLPGIYLGVVLMPLELMMIVEERSLGDSFSRCFEIIKDNFWISFAIYLIGVIIYYAASMIIGVLVGILAGLLTYFSTDSIASTAAIVSSLFSVVSWVFYIIFFVSAAFQYFTLVEQRDGTGILNRINKIGGSSYQQPGNEEHY